MIAHMPQAADFAGSIDLWMQVLPVRALENIGEGHPELVFAATMNDINDATVADRLQDKMEAIRLELATIVRQQLQEKGEPVDCTLYEWIDPYFREPTHNPLRTYVKELLQSF